MAEELSGRSLEVATAKALGFSVRAVVQPTGFALFDKDGRRCSTTKVSEEVVWTDNLQHPLTDPAAFAAVLAALDAAGLGWTITKNVFVDVEPYRTFIEAEIDYQATGDTYQEAACRALVAFKAQP